MRPLTGLFGAAGVALGAFGAHALKAELAASGHAETWRTAVFYHLIHTVALLALALFRERAEGGGKSRALGAAAVLWSAGILFFSGSLYALSLGGPRWLGPVTPLGGLLLLAGWCCVMVGGSKKKS